MALKTDYKDDVLDGLRKYRMVNNSDGTVSFVDVTMYDQEGDDYGANDINATNSAINLMDNIVDCTTARNVAAKVVTLSGFVLEKNARITVRFTNTGTTNPSSGNLTLNVNNTGAKNIIDGHTNNTTMTYTNAGYFYNNLVCEFIYNGTAWVWLNRDSNTTYTGGTLKTAAAKTGSGSTVTNTIAANTTIDNAIGTLLNNDYKINSDLTDLTLSMSTSTKYSDIISLVQGSLAKGFIPYVTYTRIGQQTLFASLQFLTDTEIEFVSSYLVLGTAHYHFAIGIKSTGLSALGSLGANNVVDETASSSDFVLHYHA